MFEPKRTYTVIEPNCHTLITSTTPSGAAKKVYSKCVRPFLPKNDIKEHKTHTIRIQNEYGKIFEYEVHEVEKHDIVKRGDKEIPYTYNVVVKSKNIHKNKESGRDSRRKSNSRSMSPIQSYSPCKEPIVFFKRSVPKK
jgi:hypothetical protein